MPPACTIHVVVRSPIQKFACVLKHRSAGNNLKDSSSQLEPDFCRVSPDLLRMVCLAVEDRL